MLERQAALCEDFPVAPHLSPVPHLWLWNTVFENESVFYCICTVAGGGFMTWLPACYGVIQGGSLEACTHPQNPPLHRRGGNPRPKLNLHRALMQLYPSASWVSLRLCYSSGRNDFNITTQPSRYSSIPLHAQEQLPRCEHLSAYTLTAQVCITLLCCSYDIRKSAVIASCWFFSLPVLIMGVTGWSS